MPQTHKEELPFAAGAAADHLRTAAMGSLLTLDAARAVTAPSGKPDILGNASNVFATRTIFFF